MVKMGKLTVGSLIHFFQTAALVIFYYTFSISLTFYNKWMMKVRLFINKHLLPKQINVYFPKKKLNLFETFRKYYVSGVQKNVWSKVERMWELLTVLFREKGEQNPEIEGVRG